eukprot:jgi/Mesvir1/7470/Mv19233-RA.1
MDSQGPRKRTRIDPSPHSGSVGAYLYHYRDTRFVDALLQTLYHIPYFCRAVLQTPWVSIDDPPSNVAAELGRIVKRLSSSYGLRKPTADPMRLLMALGWFKHQEFFKPYMGDFCCHLFERAEQGLKGTTAEGAIQRLFQGKVCAVSDGAGVGDTGGVTEPFYVLPLDIKGCKDVYASLDKYTTATHMEGQGVLSKRVLFHDLPPVLLLQLEQFEYVAAGSALVKIVNEYEISLELDLDVDGRKYLDPSADKDVRNLYELHSVICNQGKGLLGLHSALIRPSLGSRWIKYYNGLTKEYKKANILQPFGGTTGTPTPDFCGRLIRPFALVYVRKSDKERVMCPFGARDKALCGPLVDARLSRGQRSQNAPVDTDMDLAPRTVTVRVAAAEDMGKGLAEGRHLDLVDFNQVKAFEVDRDLPFSQFQERLAGEFGVPVERQDWWLWEYLESHEDRYLKGVGLPVERPWKLYRPVVRCSVPTSLPVGEVARLYPTSSTCELSLLASTAQQVRPNTSERPFMIFFKLYDPVEEKLSYVGHLVVDGHWTVVDLWLALHRMAANDHFQPLELYAASHSLSAPSRYRRLEGSRTLDKYELRMGEIVFVQKALSPDVAATCRFPDVPAFMGHALSQRRVRFFRLGVPTEEGFVLTLSKTDTYDQVACRVLCELQQMVAEGRMDEAALDMLCCRPAEPSNIWLTAHDARANRPRSQPIQRGVAILKAMLADVDDWRGRSASKIGVDDASENGADDALKDEAEDRRFNLYGREEAILYYEVVDPMRPGRDWFPRAIDVAVQDQGVKEVANFRVQLPLGSTVADVLKLVRAEPECAAMGELRLLKTREGRIYHVMPPAEALDGINDHRWNLRLEEVTGKGRCEGPGCALLPVSHVRRDEAGDSNDLVTAFGHPFMLAIGEHEKLASVKQRVQAKLGVPDEEFATWKFAIVVVDTAAPLDDNDEVVPRYQALRAGRWDAWLGIEHTGVPQAEACTQSCKGVAAPPENSTTRWSPHDHRWGHEREGQEGKRVSTCAICKRERRTLKGLDWKRELFSPTVAESPQLPAQDACAELQRALSLRPVDTWQLAGVTQRDGRVLWDTLLQMPALCTDITAADEEGRRLSSVCQQKEAALMEAIVAARASPLDDAALSARDRALADQVAALQQLEEAYERKAALSAERAAQKERLEAVSETSAVAMDVGGNSVGGEGSLSVHRPHEQREPEEVAGSRDHMSGIIDGIMSEALNGRSHPLAALTLSTEAAPAPSSVAEDTDGPPERMALGAQQKQRPVVGAMAGASGRGSSSGGAAGDPTGRAHGADTGRVRKAFALAGSAIREFNNEMYPAAQATKAAMEQLAQCLVRERAVAERLRERLDRAHQVAGDAMGDAMRSLEDATPGEDAEQARVLRALVQQKRQQVADAIAARKGLQPTEVRMGMLQRDLLEVRKKMALAEAHLKIAEMSDSEREAANQRVELGSLEEKQRAIVAALNRLTAEGQESARRLAHFYPEASALPERASQLSKALPGSSSQGKALPAGGGEGGDDVIDPDWSLSRFRNIGRPLGNSRVRLVEDAQGTPWVIKELCHERELRREGGRLQALRHPLVIRLERIFFDSGVAYLQMPYCKNGSLRAWFERIKGRAREGQPLGLEERQQVWVTMRQVFQAVAFIHRKGVVHRDLKPENILLQDDGQIALCDFGVSHDVSRTFQTTLATQLGGFTTAYAAPEVLTNQPSAKQWPFAQDMWSLGVMLLEILTGFLPHWNAVAGRLEDAQGEAVAIDAGLAGGQSQGDPWTTALRQLASSLLQVDPAGRPTSEDALSDPHGFLARDLTLVEMDQQRRMHALSSFLESLRRCPARAGRAHVLQVADLDNRPQLVQQLLEAFQADGLDMRMVFSVECGGIRVPLAEVLDRFFPAVVLPEVGLFEQGREGREDVLPDTQLQEGVAFLPRKALQGGPAKQQHLRDLRAVGRVLAKAVLEFLHVPVRFATALCCFLVGDEQLSHATPSRCLELMAEFDPVVAGQMRSVLAIAHGSGQEHGMMASMLTRCAAKDDFAITDANKGAVVRQAVQRRLVEYRREELGALREGFLSLDDLMADHLKVMTGEVLVTLFFGQDYLDVDKAVKAFVFPDDAWRGAKNGKSFKEWLHRFIREVSETGLRLLCLRALGSVDGHQSCRVLPGGKTRELPTFELGTGCMYVPEGCPDYTIFQARMHRALRAGEYGVRTDAQQGERLAREEMDAVVGAMRGQVRAGGWYRCPNGHPYAIGDCGGAMQEARCPTCGSAIGGGQHRLRADNQNALEIDGAAAPAWPPQQ